MPKSPWPELPMNREYFKNPPREYGIYPFWFLNGELEPEEMRYQLKEFRLKGMPGIILHGRFGLETPYIGPTYLERIRFAVEEAEKLGLKTWIYDEMNWPSGTADQRVLKARPDLAQRYIECLHFTVRGPWFTCLTGGDSRYIDFERSKPVAAFAISSEGKIVDLTPNLSFTNVIPWEAPPGYWRLMYIVEKQADYYIDAMNPESTAEFLRQGYDPYARIVTTYLQDPMQGFYTDEPAMHYFLSGADNPVVPWTKNMFQRFQERNGYNLRPRLPDLFFDIQPDSARVRNDFYNTLTEFYSNAFYRQIHEWCEQHHVLFTGHLLYEEWLRKLIRVEGNIFKHYQHLDVIGVDHLYPITGNRDRPDEHVAMKVGSSAAHQLGSPRLLCESFGGIFMDSTMQRMKWVADWEYVLGVNLLNPHGFHYTLEGPRKRDWPPSMFYQYPWWHYYADFSAYISRLSHLLSGGRHVAKVAVLWPIHSMFGTYTPQSHSPSGDRTETDFNVLTDLLLRLHFDFDYLDEDLLIDAELRDGAIHIRDEAYQLVILPPIAYIQLGTVEKLEQFVTQGGRLLGMIFLPAQAFGPDGLVDISDRIQALFGVSPEASQRDYQKYLDIEILTKEHDPGKGAFLRSYALNRQLPLEIQKQAGAPGKPESPYFYIETVKEANRYFYNSPGGDRRDITDQVNIERQLVFDALQKVVNEMITPDVIIDNPEIFYLHRIKDGKDIFFFINPTFNNQTAQVSLSGKITPVQWDPSTGQEKPVSSWQEIGERTQFNLPFPPAGSAFILTQPASSFQITDTNLIVDRLEDGRINGYAKEQEAYLILSRDGKKTRLAKQASKPYQEQWLDGQWKLTAESANALVLGHWLASPEAPGSERQTYTEPDVDTSSWLPMVPGAWSYQLPSEPSSPYPIPVWYRMHFQADYLPPKLDLIVDGFAGSDWTLYINGQQATAKPVRSAIDSQMKAVKITDLVHRGDNLITLRLVVTNATDGLLDLVKITGDFSLVKQSEDDDSFVPRYRMVEPTKTSDPISWTLQGYPYYSGRMRYCRLFELPATFEGQRVFIDPILYDDVLEVLVNGQSAGVRLWAPYEIEITHLLKSGENQLELRFANTLVNLLEAIERPSGMAGAPKLVAYASFEFDLK